MWMIATTLAVSIPIAAFIVQSALWPALQPFVWLPGGVPRFVDRRSAAISIALSSSYRVRSARDGREGLALAIAERPDLVVTDVMMPGAQRRRARPRHPQAPGARHDADVRTAAQHLDPQRVIGFAVSSTNREPDRTQASRGADLAVTRTATERSAPRGMGRDRGPRSPAVGDVDPAGPRARPAWPARHERARARTPDPRDDRTTGRLMDDLEDAPRSRDRVSIPR